MNTAYADFLATKAQHGAASGFAPEVVPPNLFDFQVALTDWAVRKGRAAIFADCGLGKTPMQLTWALNVHLHTGRPVLVLTPLGVTQQTVGEADKFDIEAARSHRGELEAPIVITNYERLHLFNPDDFAGVVCDESSILKSFDGKRRAAITEFMRRVPYRLLCTATAAPNDYIELGTSSEALGYLGHMDMLTRFFVNDQNNSSHRLNHRRRHQHVDAGSRWRFKGHSEEPFWRWVSSWARALRKPSDLGFEDSGFDLPALEEVEHMVEARTTPEGRLFDTQAVGLAEQREERRRTIAERCERAAELVSDTGEPAVVWCHLNAEGDLLENLIPDASQVSGRDSDEAKEEKFRAFSAGELRVLVCKPKIGAWGLNWEHCAHLTFFPSHSYEQYYQAVRRCWRFGQTRPVRVDIVTTKGEAGIKDNLQRKAAGADRMFAALVAHMNQALHIGPALEPTTPVEVPAWLS